MQSSARVPLAMFVTGGLLVAGAIASCVSVSVVNCCTEISLNFTRKCGAFQGQDCPDQIIANPAFYKSVQVLNGHHPGTPAPSVVCQYKTGRCTGLWGNNLCEMSDVKTHECANQPAGASGCTTGTPHPG